MHVKEQVKDFVHDVKRKFSKKHRRDSTCSRCAKDQCWDADSSSSCADTLDSRDDATSSSASLAPATPHRRLVSFLHRTPSTHSKGHKTLHKVRRVGSQRLRLSSAPSAPSTRLDDPNTTQFGHKQATSDARRSSFWEPRSIQDGRQTQGDYPEVIDISARPVKLGSDSTAPEEDTPRDSLSQSQPPLDESSSDTSATLVASVDFNRSVSDSDSRFHQNSDRNSAPIFPSISSMPDPDVPPTPPPPPPKPEHVVPDTNDKLIPVSLPPAPVLSPSAPAPQASPAQPASPVPVYIPRLTAPSMFLPIPNTDPLSALLTKYVPIEQRPRRDVVGEYAGRDIHEMVMSNSWRALARMARDRIVASDPEDLTKILDLWSLRLSSLARLRLTNQASAECTNLFAVLNAVQPTSAPPGLAPFASTPHPSSPALAASLSLSPSGLSDLTQLPATPTQKPSTLPGGPAASVPRYGANELLHPFELIVFHARVHYWSGDPLGYVDALSRILALCKERAREERRIVEQRMAEKTHDSDEGTTSKEDEQEGEEDAENEDGKEDEDVDTDDAEERTEHAGDEKEEKPDDVLVTAEANLSMWLERIARICLILASQMIEMNDYQAAINVLVPLCTHQAAPAFQPTSSPELHSALARVYLLSGNLQRAEAHFSIAASATPNDPAASDAILMNTALMAAATGDWTGSEDALSALVAKHPAHLTAINNLAVALLYQGRIKEGIDLLEAALNTSPASVVVAEPFLFNLSTLYELRSAAAIDKKREVLIEVAKWSGDGLKTSCLKMPSS